MTTSDDIIVRIINLPFAVRGFTVPSPDGIYNVYLNARHTQEMRRETYEHELSHIYKNDFDSERPVLEIEVGT